MIIINFLFTFMLYAHVSASLCIILSFRNKFCHLFRVISHTNTHRRRPLSNKSSSQFITSAHHYPHYEIKFKINGMYIAQKYRKIFSFQITTNDSIYSQAKARSIRELYHRTRVRFYVYVFTRVLKVIVK